jgi:hypothetical protein
LEVSLRRTGDLDAANRGGVPGGLDQGFTHVFTVTFASKEVLEKQYLHEPAHQEFVSLLGGVLDKVLVVDYVAQ